MQEVSLLCTVISKQDGKIQLPFMGEGNQT